MKSLFTCLLPSLFLLLSCGRDLTGPSSGPELAIINAVQLAHALTKVVFIDAQHGWALADSGGVYRTTDGGGHWEFSSVGVAARLLDMSFVNASSGWVCGFDTTVLHTSDGGRTWQRRHVRNAVDSTIQHIGFINQDDGWLFTAWGDVYGTTDGGGAWELLSRMEKPGLSYVKMWGSQGIVAQYSGPALQTQDGGRSWTVLNTPTERVGQAFFIDPGHGWLIQSIAPYS